MFSNLRLQVKNAPTAPEEIAQLAAAAEAERLMYDGLKAELRTAAAVLAALCFAACYGFYGRVLRYLRCVQVMLHARRIAEMHGRLGLIAHLEQP